MPNASESQVYMFGFRAVPGAQGGVETHAEHLAPQLAHLGHSVTACLRSPYVREPYQREWRGVRLLRLWTVRNTYLEAMLHSLMCAIVAGLSRPQIVHVHGIGPALVTPLLRVFGLRVVVTHHGEDYNREKWGWAARTVLRIGEALGMRFAHGRIAISRTIANLVATKFGEQCDVIPNGIVLSELPTDAERVKELGLEPGRYILTVGRLVPEKRQLDLVRAFCAAKCSGWKLAIVGSVDHQNKYSETLASAAANANGVVMTGFQSGESLRQLYAHAGLFVLASSHEGLPIALLEALSYGLPVLVSNIPANLEVVDNPKRTFEMGNIQDLSSRIADLTLMQPSVAEREKRRRNHARRYDWTEIAARTSATYQKVLNQS